MYFHMILRKARFLTTYSFNYTYCLQKNILCMYVYSIKLIYKLTCQRCQIDEKELSFKYYNKVKKSVIIYKYYVTITKTILK